MADYYLTVNGEYFDEAGDFNDGVSYFHELLASGTVSTLNVAGGTTSVTEGYIYANGANLNLTGGVFGNAVYTGWQTPPEETPVTTQTVVVDGATIKGNLLLGNYSGTSSNNIDFTFKSGTITGQILGGNTGSVTGDVTISILGGISGNISGTAMGAGTTQGSTVINFENANYASKFMYAAYRGIPKDVTINFKSGLMHVVCLGAVSAGINLDCPITLNLSGGTVNWLIASYNGATRKGDTTINMTGGYVANYFFMGVNKAPSGVDAATFVETVGNNYFNLSGGTASAPCCAGGKFIQEGNNYINISGDFLGKNICGGAYATTGVVKGNVYITVNGGFWDKDHAYAPSYWINGGGYNGKVEGDITIDVLSGTLYHIFGGGREAGATTLGNININLKDGEFHGVVQGGGYKTSVTGDITINVSGGTFFREMKGKYGQSGWIIGGATHTTAASTEGDITVNVTGGTNLSTICGGNWSAISHVGNIALTISDVTLGFQTGEDAYEWGNVYAVAGSSTEVIGETFTADISNVTSNGTIYVCNGGAYIEGNTVITVKNSTFDALAIEYGYFTVTKNEETGENEYSDYRTTEINGNVLFDVTDVTIAGNAWGKGKNFDLASFVEEDQGATLAVSGKLTVGGEVAYFQNITIAAGATIEAASVTASAITATAAAEDGAYLLATGFAAQDSVITVLNASGSTIGTVTLSEAVTSGSFNVGSDTYGVEVTTDGLYLLKNAEAPEPATDYFVVVNGGTTFFGAIEDAQAFALENAGSVLYVNTTEDVCQYLNGIETHFIADIATAKYRNGGVDGRVNAAQPASTKMVFDAGLYDSIFAGSYNGGTSTNPDYTAKSFEVVFNAGTTANLYASGRTIAAGFVGAEKSTITVNGGKIGMLAACYTKAGLGAVEINVNGGSITTLESTLTTQADITGGITYNITGGNIGSFFYAGSQNTSASTTTIQGGVVVNISGGKFSGRVSSATNNQKSNVTITGGMVLNLTGGSFAKDVYGTGDAVGTLAGGITIIIDGLESKNKVYGAYRVATESVNITMKSGSMTSLSGGAGEINMTVDTVINLEGGSVDFIFGTSGKFFESVGTTQVNVSNGVVNTLLSLNGGTAAGATLIGDATLNLTGGTVLGTITVNGGSAVKEAYTGALVGNANVNISGGTVSDIVVVTYGEVEGNVAVNLAGGVYTGKISGSNAAVSGTSVLNIAGAISTTGAVSEFDTITIDLAKNGSLTAASITAEAITVYGATVSCTLATGFGVQTTSVTLDGIGTIALSAEAVSGSITAGDKVYTVSMQDNALLLNVAGGSVPPVVESKFTAEVVLTITDTTHAYFGATGSWKVLDDQKIVWQDLSTLSGDYQILGLGKTAADKAMSDVYVYSASNKYIGAYVTDASGAVVGFESIFTGENALMQVGLGDFTADGVSDLMLRTADGYLGFYANGAFTAVQGLGTEWSVEALGDVNGDGTTDIVIAHAQGGYVGAYLIGKDGGITWGDLGSTEGGIEIVGAGDFNADGTDDVLVKVGNYYGAWLCGNGAVTGFFGIGNFDAEVQDIADYNADGTDDVLFRTADGIIGAALITGADASTWAQYGALGAEWSTKGVGIL